MCESATELIEVMDLKNFNLPESNLSHTHAEIADEAFERPRSPGRISIRHFGQSIWEVQDFQSLFLKMLTLDADVTRLPVVANIQLDRTDQ